MAILHLFDRALLIIQNKVLLQKVYFRGISTLLTINVNFFSIFGPFLIKSWNQTLKGPCLALSQQNFRLDFQIVRSQFGDFYGDPGIERVQEAERYDYNISKLISAFINNRSQRTNVLYYMNYMGSVGIRVAPHRCWVSQFRVTEKVDFVSIIFN